MRHGYYTAELIIWYMMKQLILPPKCEGGHHEEGNLVTTEDSTVNSRPSIQVVGGGAALSKLVHQEQPECSPKDTGRFLQGC